MKKLFFLLLLVTGITTAQTVNIPDANFKLLLLSATPDNGMAYGNGGYIAVDANDDGEIQLVEAQAIDSLDLGIMSVSDPHIADLTGISSFSNLKKLACNYQSSLSSVPGLSSLTNLKILQLLQTNLTSLDVSMLTNLESLRTEDSYNLASINVNGLTHLIDFYCDYNNLSSLNLTGLVNLRNFTCSNNHLAALDVSGLPGLFFFECNNNLMTSLTLGNLSVLNLLQCYGNQLTSLDFSGVPNLTFLSISDNQFTSIDLSALNQLGFFDCAYNQLAAIDISGSTQLGSFYCNNNLLITLDCSHNQLGWLDCSNNEQLQWLSMKNGTTVQSFEESLVGCTSLAYICIDEIAPEPEWVNIALAYAGLTGVVVNSYCSFTPGGNYNTIAGTVTFDANNNGCDSNDIFQPNIRIGIDDATTTGASFTNATGNYAFYTQDGSFDITSSIENPALFTISPQTVTIPFADNNNNVVTQDFCIAANGIHPDAEVVIAPVVPAMPGFEAEYVVVYKNKGNQTLSGNITFNFDDTVLDFVSSTVPLNLQSPGSLAYDYTNLLPFESRSFYIVLNVNTPTDDPPVNNDDQLIFTATVNPVADDETPSDNTFQYDQTVVGSYDPNDIICIEGDVVSPLEIGKYLHYIINFENTGTADAQNIVVKDTIDITKYDVSSLQVMGSSNPVTARITGNVVEFIFQNINLHSGGHGNILLKLKSNNTLVEGDTVSKRADIFFDYNAPITTEMANTTFQLLSNPTFPTDASIVLYPNPTKSNVNIKADHTIQSVQLFDVQGRLLQTKLVSENTIVLDITSHSTGVYFIKVTTDKGIKVEKIVRE